MISIEVEVRGGLGNLAVSLLEVLDADRADVTVLVVRDVGLRDVLLHLTGAEMEIIDVTELDEG